MSDELRMTTGEMLRRGISDRVQVSTGPTSGAHTMTSPSRVEVVYVANLRVGDLVAGDVVPDAPTRPVQPYAAAMVLRNISEVPAAVYTLWWSDDPTSGMHSAPKRGTDQVLVIR